MAMNRNKKEVVVDSISKGFASSEASFVVGVKGMTVEQLESLRRTLRKEGASLKIAKVRLMKRALQQVEQVKGLESFLSEQIALVFAQKESPAIAKCLVEFADKHKGFDVCAGFMDAAIMQRDAIKTIASLPSRDVLIARLLATMMAPVTSVVMVLKAVEEQKNK